MHLYPGIKTMDCNIGTCFTIESRIVTISNMFDYFNFEFFGIALIAL